MLQVGIIIAREFNERVRKKSFIITTLLTPILVIAMMITPALIMEYGKGETKRLLVVDESGIVASGLENDEILSFETVDTTVGEAREASEEEFGVLHIGADILTNPASVWLYANQSSSMAIEQDIRSQVKHIVEAEKLKAYDIENLPEIMQEVETSIRLQTIRSDEESAGMQSSSVAAAIGMILGAVLYFVLLIYGMMVMQSVIDEKSSRVMEVVVSSVRPFQLMMGKILGIALVAVVQLLLWGVLIVGAGTLLLPHLVPADMMESVQTMQSGAFDAAAAVDVDPDLLEAMAVVTDPGYVMQLFGLLILFVVGGYLLYSAMFAAVGSAVDNMQDAQQLQLPITLPIIIGFLAMMTVMQDPNSPIAFWFSMIPFTSPMVMAARIPSGIPTWEIVLSVALLYLSFVAMVWLAAKVYRVGIFMYGKKPTLKELFRWMRYDY